MIIWLIGMSGSGKTTLGKELYGRLKQEHKNLLFLDGDLLREVWGDNIGHTIEDRMINAHKISHLCKMLDSQGVHAVAAVLSIFPDWQKWNRNNFSQYFEVFLDVPLDILEARDPKQIYKKARCGEIKDVVGYDILFPEPVEVDLVLDEWEGEKSADECVELIMKNLPSFH